MVVSTNTQSLDAIALEQNARHRGFALIRTGNAWRLYENPGEIIVVSDAGALTDSLRRIEKHVSAGGEAAGLLRYEAGYTFEPLLQPLLSKQTGNLLWFGLYENVSVFDDIVFPVSEQVNHIENLSATIRRDQYSKKLH